MKYAILRESEQSGDDFQHGVKYRFMYDEHDVFFIWVNGEWEESPSTAFDFTD